MIIRLNDNPSIIVSSDTFAVVVKPDTFPVHVTGNTYYNFIASGETVITQVQTGNLVDVTIYNPSGSSTTWGMIVGDISNQTDLWNILTGHTADISYISGVTDTNYQELTGLTSAIQTYTGTTAPNTFVNVAGDTMTGNLNLQSMLNVTGTSTFFGDILTPNASPNQAITGNVRIGSGAGIAFTNGNGNVAIGENALNDATSILSTTAIGTGAMNKMNSGGSNNTAVGMSALGALLNGGNNIALGHFAGLRDNTGDGLENLSNSILIGQNTRAAESVTNTVVIGYAITSKGSNTVMLGNTSIVGTYLNGTIYSGETALHNIFSLTGHSHSNYVEDSAFNTYTGTTAPASFLPITGLTGYWTSGQTVDYVTGYTPTLEWGNITGSISGQTDLQAALDAKATILANVSTVTGTTYTALSADNGKILEFTNTGATTITLPTGLTTGYQITVVNYSSSVKTFAAGSGATVRSKSSYLKLSTIYNAATAYYRGSDTWVVFGDLTAT